MQLKIIGNKKRGHIKWASSIMSIKISNLITQDYVQGALTVFELGKILDSEELIYSTTEKEKTVIPKRERRC